MDNEFLGFNKEMPSFLFELQFNNNIENQTSNAEKYKTLISAPLKQLYYTLLPTAMGISDQLESKPSRCISSPYKDRRFSPSVPLKEYMYVRFMKASGGLGRWDKVDIPGLYFHMGSDFYSYGIFIYHHTTKGMEELRQRILSEPNKFEKELKKLKSAGFNIHGEAYKRDHFPDASGVIKDVLNLRSLCIDKHAPIGEEVFSHEIADIIANGFVSLGDFLKMIM